MKAPVFDPSWPDDVRELFRHDMQELWDPSIAPHIYLQYQSQLDLYLSLVERDRLSILDVGCAQATLAMLLAERGHRVTAVDIRPQFLEYARSRYTHGDITFTAANVLEDSIEGRFDLVFANQIIEHVVYPEEMLRRLARILAPGGRLVVSTPNAMYFRSSLPTYSELGDPEQWESRQFTADGDGHFFAYTMAELVRFFEAVGFREVRGVYFESPFVSGHAKVRYLHSFFPTSFMRVLDRVALAMPGLAKKLAHQMLVTGVAG